ncbi:MAG: Hsp20/alpha crystallin family protein [Chromatiales bacterium]|nr:Hsp20/alpha crystallin family protein [Chromatiales bacterium]
MVGSLFSRDLFRELDLLQREMQGAFGISPSIRGIARGGFPALNVGNSPQAVHVYAFVPGIDPSAIQVEIEKGVLVISGERSLEAPTGGERSAVHIDERFSGRFRRVVSLPDDVDPAAATAAYRDGVLQVQVPRREAARPQRINVQ